MFYKNLVIFTLLQLGTLWPYLASAQSAYCHVNKTSVEYRPVQKTRIVAKAPKGMFKTFKKTKYYNETFTDNERIVTWKLVTECCQGYQMSQPHLCEPICTSPACGELEKCVKPNHCVCRSGYERTEATNACEPTARTDPTPTTTELELNTVAPEDLDGNWEWATAVYDNTEDWLLGDTDTIEESTHVGGTTECPAYMLYYMGACRTQLFENNNGTACQAGSCGEHARCLENNICTCETDFVLEVLSADSTMEDEGTTTEESTSTASTEAASNPRCLPLLQQLQDAVVVNDNAWLIFVLLGSASLFIAGAAVFLGFRLSHRQTGSLDTKAKEDLCCQYKNDDFAKNSAVY